MTEIKIKMEDGKAKLYTPYSSDFVARIKKIGSAQWDRECRCWTIPADAVPAAREIMRDVYGHDDQTDDEVITLRVTVDQELSESGRDVCLFGKCLAHASGRDSGARIGDDVAYIHGGATSGGSRSYWSSIVEAGSVIILSNVSKRLYDAYTPIDGIHVEIVKEQQEDKRQKLLKEKAQLLNRLAEIESLLSDLEKNP